jgi:hypothetical protein
VLRTTNDVFQEYDRIIDQKSDGQRHRHQSKIVDRIIERVHHRDRNQERERKRDDRDQGIGGAAEENEDDDDDEDERYEESRLHVGNGMHDCL